MMGLGDMKEGFRVDLYSYIPEANLWQRVGIRGDIDRISSRTTVMQIEDRIFLFGGLNRFGEPTDKLYELFL